MRLIAVCQYITTLGVIFSNKGLITINQRNQTVPIFNALFKYLNESSNVTEARIDLLGQVINSIKINNGSDIEEMILDMKYVNESYQYIINIGLFAHYGNITGYLSGIMNEAANKSIFDLREIVSKDLTKNYVSNNLCSLQNSTFRLSPLAIENIFQDNVWPGIIKANRGKNVKVEYFLKRSKRHPLGSSDDNDDLDVNNKEDNFDNIQTNSDDQSFMDDVSYNQTPTKIRKISIQAPTDDLKIKNESEDDTSGISKEAISSILHRHLPFEPKNPTDYNFVDTLRNMDKNFPAVKQNKEHLKLFRLDLNALALSQIKENWLQKPIKVWYSEGTDSGKIVEVLKNRKGKTFFFNDITLLTKVEDGKSPWKTWRPYETPDFIYRINYFITINSESGFVHFGKSKSFQNYYLTFSEVTFNVNHTEIMENINNIILNMYLVNNPLGKQEWENNRVKELQLLIRTERGKSRRMQSIEKAADLIASIVPMHTFEMSVNILKGYILKLEESTTLVPTYEEMARDFCNNLKINAFYNEWIISNHKFIDDVLFETQFDTSINFTHLMTKMKPIFPRYYSRFNENDYNKYANSSLLKNSLRLEDYFLLKLHMQRNREYQLHEYSENRILFALYRLALRECDNEWMDYNIKLYCANCARSNNSPDFHKSLSVSNYTLQRITKFSFRYETEKNKLSNILGMNVKCSWMELKLSNQAGIACIDPLFDNYPASYLIPPGTFSVSDHGLFEIDDEIVPFIKMEDRRSKESKMIDMIGKLHQLLINNPAMFNYYD